MGMKADQPSDRRDLFPAAAAGDSTRYAFLSRASEIFATSLDYEVTLKKIAELVVPEVADWCHCIMLGENDRLISTFVAHSDKSKVAEIQDIARRYPPQRNPEYGAYKVIRTGISDFTADVPDDVLVNNARNVEHLEFMRKFQLKSVMNVPISAHGKIYGALMLVRGESGRRFSTDDLALAEDLGRRCGLAVHSARLYEAERQSRARAEAAALRHSTQFLVSQALMNSVDVTGAASSVLAAIGNTLGWDAGALWIEDNGGPQLRSIGIWTSPLSPQGAQAAPWQTLSVSSQVGPIADVYRHGRPVWLSGLRSESADRSDGWAPADARSAILIPVRAERGTIGILGMWSRTEKPPDPEATDSLATLGNAIGQFVERVHSDELVRQLSTPALPIAEQLLLMPLIGRVTAERAAQLTERLLGAVRNHRTRIVVVDLTGVAFMDRGAAVRIVQLVESARLLGARVIFTGISSEVSSALVGLGVDLLKLESYGDLRRGIQRAGEILRSSGLAGFG